MYMYMYMYMYICTYVCMYLFIYVCVNIYNYTYCTYIYIDMYTHINILGLCRISMLAEVSKLEHTHTYTHVCF